MIVVLARLPTALSLARTGYQYAGMGQKSILL